MKINLEELFKDLQNSCDALTRSNTKSTFISNFEDFQKLNSIFALITDFYYEESEFVDNNYKEEYLNSSNKKNIFDFYNAYYENEMFFLSATNNFDKALNDINFFSMPFYDTLEKFNEKDYIDIILFFCSKFGNNVYKIAKKYFDEQKIQNGLHGDIEFEGAYFDSRFSKTGYISIYDNKLNSKSLSFLAHELGHVVDREVFIFPQQKKLSIKDELMIEVPSAFYEIEFLNFLKNEHIDVNGSLILLNSIYDMVREFNETLEEIYCYDDAYVDESGDLIVKIEDNVFDSVNLKQVVYYSVGYLLGFHLSNLYENERNKFDKKIFNLLCARKEKSITQSIQDLGYSLDEFISGKIILPKVKETTLELKKRYNIKY